MREGLQDLGLVTNQTRSPRDGCSSKVKSLGLVVEKLELQEASEGLVQETYGSLHLYARPSCPTAPVPGTSHATYLHLPLTRHCTDTYPALPAWLVRCLHIVIILIMRVKSPYKVYNKFQLTNQCSTNAGLPQSDLFR